MVNTMGNVPSVFFYFFMYINTNNLLVYIMI